MANSNKIAIIALPEGWFSRVITEFNPDEVELFVSTPDLRRQLIDDVGEQYRVHLLDLNRQCEAAEVLNTCGVIVADQWQMKKIVPIHVKDPVNTRLASFAHASDAPPVHLVGARNYMICSSQRLLTVMKNHFNYQERNGEYEAEAILARMPYLQDADALEYEAGFSGLYHLDPACFTAFENRGDYRKRYLEVLGVDTEDPRPIITYFVDEIADFAQAHAGLSSITDDYIVAIKTFGDYMVQFPFNGVHVIEQRQHNDLIRLGSDFILAGVASGSLATCMMIGLRAIPIYTQTLHRNAVTRGQFYRKEVETLTPYPLTVENLAGRTSGYATELVPVVDLGDAAMLRERLEDDAIWDGFEARVDAWSQEARAYGSYLKVGAAAKTADMIRAIAWNGTLGDDAEMTQSYPIRDAEQASA